MRLGLIAICMLGAALAGCRADRSAEPATGAPPLLPTPALSASAPARAPTALLPPTPLLAQATALPTPLLAQATAIPASVAPLLVVTNAAGRQISFVDPAAGVLAQVEVGAAPWGLARAPGEIAYVATAEGVAVVDLRQRTRLASIPYRAELGRPQFGEYRPGGMGIAVAPDGRRVYVGVFLPDRSGRLEVIDTAQQIVIASVPIGVRPFQVLVSQDGQAVYTIDRDTFTVTVVDTATFEPRTLAVEPLGNTGWGSWDKPHYAVLRSDGHLLLPIQGRVLVDLDPASGKTIALPMRASTHQHGVALSPDRRRLLIIGTGPAGEARAGPRLTVLDLQTLAESDIPLDRPHEQIAISPDGHWAYLTGGMTFANEGWDGLTIVDLQRQTVAEIAVPDRPLDIMLLPAR